ncbi:hypothetical protein V499_02186 [Pseudogymnoascus sp. VKM F-103]|uniref:SnoaL-like domain-containing protein n=1 Tax=Pseudogymnoascus verrucosus TaxID=342668 RepID=A0A1B8G7J1_9PEZI|nr:uncharacterized protein VE01_09365 [Pseudogymnoascus verrucosus]KFY78693.1 hypothetical protein V499_02186 [Pseudogymnoascus sp. VKM F-103]OBT91781.1 hypothetical protein VE01_09365 [Pseudogymnoascus verrucosus]
MPVPIEIAETIFRKKSQYGRYIDTKQWNKFAEVALPNAELSFFDSDGSILVAGKTPLVFSSSQAFTSFFSKFFANAQTLHMFGPGELEQIKSDEVKATWGMEDQIILNGTGGLVEMRGGGYYYETWKMHGDDWFLASLRLERTYQKTSLTAKVFIFLERYSGLTFV